MTAAKVCCCDVHQGKGRTCPECEIHEAPVLTWSDIAAEVLRVFPGSVITGSRIKDPAECHDAE